MRRRAVLCAPAALALALALSLRVGGAHSVRAAAITSDQLATATLSADDLPGFRTIAEGSPQQTGELFDSVYRRALLGDAESEAAGGRLVIGLMVPVSAFLTQQARLYAGDGRFLMGFAGQNGFQRIDRLGVGDADSAGSLINTDARTGVSFTVYVDFFVRGRLIVSLQYADLGKTGPSVLADLAGKQDAKLTGSGALPAALLSPSANGAQFLAHRWYTSSDLDATVYYCDDDPGWRGLGLGSLESFATVSELLTQYPDRTLNRPCGDGASGP